MPIACQKRLTTSIDHKEATHPAPWERFWRPFVRDLAFAIACPDVLTHWIDFAPLQNTQKVHIHTQDFWQAQFSNYQARLEQLDTTDAYQDLTRYLLARPSPNRLGFHFEGLLSFWLEDGFARGLHPFETLASNVQLYQGKQTTGELDLILYDHDNKQTQHWELAVKFFMGSHPFMPSNWVGINSKDNLERKMTHMQTKQFRAVWVDTKDHGRVKINKRFAVIKGRFFLPYRSAASRPDWMMPHFPLHRWIDPRDAQNLDTLNHIDKAILRRAHYIEWFTKRAFYDDKQGQIPFVKDTTDHAPATGLYFEGDQPLVIYSKPPSTISN